VTILQAILLGLVQGLTEFLPISSTAHLTLVGKLFHLVDAAHPETWTEYIAVIQLGTLTAVVVYFWKEIAGMLTGLVADTQSGMVFKGFSKCRPDTRLALFVVLGSVPVAVIGLAFRHQIEGALTKSVPVIAGSMVGLAAILFLAERFASQRSDLNHIRWVDALVIGCAQAMALIPGASRSGTTITAGLFMGLKRETAARFSFLLSIPAVFASGFLELKGINAEVFTYGPWNLLIGTVVAGVSGYLAIAWLLKFLMKNSTMVFIFYRVVIGSLLFFLLWNNLITP
jgi:undecaprenyl-diphosphatase